MSKNFIPLLNVLWFFMSLHCKTVNMKQLFPVCLIVVIALLLGSCAPSVVAVRPGPVTVVRPLRPSPAHVWVSGGYVWRGGRYRYVDGYWAVPRRHRQTYVEGYWKPVRRGYVWVPGYWR